MKTANKLSYNSELHRRSKHIITNELNFSDKTKSNSDYSLSISTDVSYIPQIDIILVNTNH